VTTDQIRNDPAYYEPFSYRRNEYWIGALVKNPGVWWEDLDTNPEILESVIESVISQWDMYFRGDVYMVAVEYRERCACCDHVNTTEEDTLGGVYGSDYLREVLRGDMGLSDDEIDAAEITGNAGWVIR
jgi:hypothetical protein